MSDTATDKEIIKYMSKKMGKSYSVCSRIFTTKTRHEKDLMRKRHLRWKISVLEKAILDFHKESHGCYRKDDPIEDEILTDIENPYEFEDDMLNSEPNPNLMDEEELRKYEQLNIRFGDE